MGEEEGGETDPTFLFEPPLLLRAWEGESVFAFFKVGH